MAKAKKKRVAKKAKKVAPKRPGAKKRPAPKKKAPRRAARKPAASARRKKPARPAPAPAPAEASLAPPRAPEVMPGEGGDETGGALAEAREVFNHYDRDGSGTIERGEFARLLEALGAGLSEEEMAAGLSEVDRNHSGRISWDEFSAWWSSR